MTVRAGRSLARNSVLTMLSKGIEALGSFAATIIVARYLGRAGYGLYAEIVSTIMLMWPLVDMGLDQILVRELSVDRRRSGLLMGSAFLVRFLAAAAAVFLLGLWLIITNASSTWVWAALLASANILVLRQISNLVCRAYFLGIERVEWDVTTTTLGQVARISGLLIVAAGDGGLLAILAVPIAAEFIQICLGLVIAGRAGKGLSPKADKQTGSHLIREAWPLLIRILLVTAYFHVDNAILGRVLPHEQLALFSAPFRLVSGMVMALIPALWVFLPTLARQKGENVDLMRRAAPLASNVAALGGMGLALFSPWLIRVAFGAEFVSERSIAILRLLALMPALNAVSYLMELELLAQRRQILAIYAAGPALLVKIILDVALWGLFGPLIGAVTSLVGDVTRLAILRRWAGRGWSLRALLPIALLGILVCYLLMGDGFGGF